MVGEVITLDEFHYERADPVRLLQAMNVRDVRVVQRREHLRFPLEARQAIGIVGKGLGQDFDRHVAIERRIAGAIDLAHPAHTDLNSDFVDAETGAGGKGQEGSP